MLRNVIRFFHRALTLLTALVLASAALYAGFALWDNSQIYTAAESSFDEMRAIWDQREAREDMGDSFADLVKINEDVTAWITVPGTAIDYPVLRGRTNMTYINKDVYGKFSLSGSIFLDSRNDRDYADGYSLLYGHNMSQHRMFADVNLFKDKTFFDTHTGAMLYLPDRGIMLTSLSVLVTPDTNAYIFNPENWTGLEPDKILEIIKTDAMYISEENMGRFERMLKEGRRPQIVCLSTCSSEFTNARTALITFADPEV